MLKLFADSETEEPNDDSDLLVPKDLNKTLNTAIVEEIMSETNNINNKNDNGGHWVIGDEDKETYDGFPQIGEEIDHAPPAAPSDGQGGYHTNGNLPPEARQALLEKRRRLK